MYLCFVLIINKCSLWFLKSSPKACVYIVLVHSSVRPYQHRFCLRKTHPHSLTLSCCFHLFNYRKYCGPIPLIILEKQTACMQFDLMLVEVDASSPLAVYKDGRSHCDVTHWFVNTCFEALRLVSQSVPP